MDNLEQVDILIDRGLLLFPCFPNKKPATAHGYLDATSHKDSLKAYFKDHPDFLIGIACKPSGIFCIDVDDPESFEEFIARYGDFDITLSQRTPRGGFHLFFAHPLNIEIPNNAGVLWPGVDLRSNGYACTGIGYEWLGEGINTPIAWPPRWLFPLIERINHIEERPGLKVSCPIRQDTDNWRNPRLIDYFVCKYSREAKPGIRNQMGFALAIQLRDAGLTLHEAEEYMLEYAHRVPNGIHPYTEREALLTLRSAFTRARRDPVEMV